MHDSFLICSYKLLCSASVTNTSESVSSTTYLNHVGSCLVYSLLAQVAAGPAQLTGFTIAGLCFGSGKFENFPGKTNQNKTCLFGNGFSLVTFSQSRDRLLKAF